MQLQKQVLKRRVLDQVNSVRAIFGAEPLPELWVGSPGSPDDCSIKRSLGYGCPALNISVFSSGILVRNSAKARRIAAVLGTRRKYMIIDHIGYRGWGVALTPEMAAFIDRFDEYKIKELIDPDYFEEDGGGATGGSPAAPEVLILSSFDPDTERELGPDDGPFPGPDDPDVPEGNATERRELEYV